LLLLTTFCFFLGHFAFSCAVLLLLAIFAFCCNDRGNGTHRRVRPTVCNDDSI
jgi:hypothetical protein